MIWARAVTGKLTKKQEQKWDTIMLIIKAFYVEDKKQSRTWAQLKRITKLSNGTLSKYIRELIDNGIVKGEVEVVENRLQTLFEYSGRGLIMKGVPLGFWKSGRPQKRVLDERKRRKKIIGKTWKEISKEL